MPNGNPFGRGGFARRFAAGAAAMPLERKSVEPMAAAVSPERVSAKHQSLLHFVAQSPWIDDKVLAKVQELVLPSIKRGGPIEAWIVDDTGLPKKGKHSGIYSRRALSPLHGDVD